MSIGTAAIGTAERPAHHIYIRLDAGSRGSPATLTAIHVQGEHSTSGNYFSAPLAGDTAAEQRLGALLTAVDSVPYYTRLYIHTTQRELRDLVRTRATEWPQQLRDALQRRNVTIRIGSLEHLELFWVDLLNAVSRKGLPSIGPLNHYQLYTYAVCDGRRTYASGLLYGDGQLHIYSHQEKGSELAAGELTMAAWAFSVLPMGKCVELHQNNPELRDYWEGDAAQFVDLYPGAEDSSKQIGKHLKAKALRFNVTAVHKENDLWRGVRWLAGRMLA
ncbi:hypothetical protein [Deinococcus sp. Leaf326]|uniref:hypothetical protein n=1 Tax=Deinococcus sp. Leaf326 TaxID=1736338 RepID=UPI0006F88963|nr:hypothetical protein [Deinococcus sp. Leaf326]KQR21879.1 hypothetical protein ASF71_19430 [Deinococcus sp. Leaf326]